MTRAKGRHQQDSYDVQAVSQKPFQYRADHRSAMRRGHGKVGSTEDRPIQDAYAERGLLNV